MKREGKMWMRRSQDERMEFIALELISSNDEPVGATRLVASFCANGIQVAEATAGRFLRELDLRGLTKVVGRRGRILSKDGEAYLREFRQRERANGQHAELIRVIETTDVDQLVDLLFVRRALEPEAARLAALRATDGDLTLIKATAEQHLQNVTAGADGGGSAVHFHRVVAEASHNPMLVAIANMLLDPANDPLQRLLDMISSEEGSSIALGHEHGDIVRAIQKRDSSAAEVAMRKHVDDLIAMVEHYRVRCERRLMPVAD